MTDKNSEKRRKGLDAVRRHVVEMIAEHGWAVLNIGAESNTPSYSYTVGLMEKGLPEVIIFGLPPATAQSVLNTVAKQLLEGLTYSDDVPLLNVFQRVPT